MRHVGKGRVVHDNPELLAWREAIGWAVKPKLDAITKGPVTMGLSFYLPVESTWGNERKNYDLDKLARAVLDALEGIAYINDRQVEQFTELRKQPAGAQVPGVRIALRT